MNFLLLDIPLAPGVLGGRGCLEDPGGGEEEEEWIQRRGKDVGGGGWRKEGREGEGMGKRTI